MEKQRYSKPEFRAYGQISTITQAVGMNGATGDNAGNSGMDKTS